MGEALSAGAPAGSIGAWREAARALVAPEVWRYLEAGAGDALTLHANRAAFDRRWLVPRVLRDLRGGHTRLALFGLDLAHPLLVAPIAYQRLFHPMGETATAVAASAQGGLMIISTLASQPLEAIVAAAEARAWFQLYWQDGREASLRLARRALAAGCRAVVLTVDAPVKHATLQLPPGVSAVNLDTQPGAAEGGVFDGFLHRAPRWDDVAWLRERIQAPLLVKGVLAPADAQQAVALGLDGIVVSNHGGRVLDGACAALDVLPEIAGAIGGRVPVLFDSGVRSGRDAYKALALGATAVLAGRPCIWGLVAGGPHGVARVLRTLRDELEMTMALMGNATLASVREEGGGQAVPAGIVAQDFPGTAATSCVAGLRGFSRGSRGDHPASAGLPAR